MSDRLKKDTERLSLPMACAAHLCDASRAELLVLLSIGAGTPAEVEALSADLKRARLTRAEIEEALAFWREREILHRAGGLREDSLPTYAGDEMAQMLAEGDTKGLVEELQITFGKVFTPFETNKVLALGEYVGLSSTYLLLLADYLASQGRKGVSYFVKTAQNLYHEGVDSEQALSAYLTKKQKNARLAARVAKLLGWGERTLTKREEQTVEEWQQNGYRFELIRLAYEEAVKRASAPSGYLRYMNGVLESWKQKGIKTPDDVSAEAERFRSERQGDQKSSFSTDDFFEQALKKSKEALQKGGKSK